mmetsp:Transcript_34107/g.106782  ORF Transcript_34107/g.106782 Transcript_34107/m.106782 type:complete len:139 (+) Transcript_34107:1476-1892(+)
MVPLSRDAWSTLDASTRAAIKRHSSSIRFAPAARAARPKPGKMNACKDRINNSQPCIEANIVALPRNQVPSVDGQSLHGAAGRVDTSPFRPLSGRQMRVCSLRNVKVFVEKSLPCRPPVQYIRPWTSGWRGRRLLAAR